MDDPYAIKKLVQDTNQEDLTPPEVITWYTLNCIRLNVDKSNAIFFGTKFYVASIYKKLAVSIADPEL